ncbi:hypothetical protein [Candidatus Hepatobacter penaei]|uniref:hypothetical protein n=1 Tax=Candidatus Hepatobacter penaei TaxID=1274402 RepID=UPI00058AE6F2|nr:hypothetical protein [Candidatus Hepatobacter penaei]TGW14754.1 hypothetical protein EIL50_03830 [bacterium NHP-B]
MVTHFAHTKAKLFSWIGGLRGSQKLSFVWGGLLLLGLGVGLWHIAHFVLAPPTRTPLPVIYPPAGPMRIPPQEPSQTPSYRVYDHVAPAKKKMPDTLNVGEERPPAIPRKPEVKQKSKTRVNKRVNTSPVQGAPRAAPYPPKVPSPQAKGPSEREFSAKGRSSSAAASTKKLVPGKASIPPRRVSRKATYAHPRTPHASSHARSSASRRPLPRSAASSRAGWPLSKKTSLPRVKKQKRPFARPSAKRSSHTSTRPSSRQSAKLSSKSSARSIDSLLSTMNNRKRTR